MIKKIYIILKDQGILGLFETFFRLVIPRCLACYQHCKPFFQCKIGLVIGWPSKKFKRSGLMPVYAVADRVDNLNFSNHTIWEGSIKEGATFRTRLAVEVIHHIGLQILAVEVLKPYDIFIVAQKLIRGQKVRNERFRRIDTTFSKFNRHQ